MLMVQAGRHPSAPEVPLLASFEVLPGPLWTRVWAGETPARETLAGDGR